MTWQPINLTDTAQRLNLEILRAAANKDIHMRREDGRDVYSYDDMAGDYHFDGADVTDEVCRLVWDRFLSDRTGAIRITDAGRAYMEQAAA